MMSHVSSLSMPIPGDYRSVGFVDKQNYRYCGLPFSALSAGDAVEAPSDTGAVTRFHPGRMAFLLREVQ